MSNRNSNPNPYQQHQARIQRTSSMTGTGAEVTVEATALPPPPRPFFVAEDDTYTTDTDSDREVPRQTSATTTNVTALARTGNAPLSMSRRRPPQPAQAAISTPGGMVSMNAPRPVRGRVMHSRRASGSSQLASNNTNGVEEVPRTSPQPTTTPTTNPSSDEAENQGTNSAEGNSDGSEQSQSGKWTPTSLYSDSQQPHNQTQPPHPLYSSAPLTPHGPNHTTRPPPSSFPFPFQAYPGNPDPGTSIPGIPRRYSFELNQQNPRRSSVDSDTLSIQGGYASSLLHGAAGLGRPYAPFMAASGSSPSLDGYAGIPTTGSSSSLYKQSVAATISQGPLAQQQQFFDANGNPVAFVNVNGQPVVLTADGSPVTRSAPGTPNPNGTSTNGSGSAGANIPRNSSTPSFRAPFLSPASRPSSSLWSPPSYPKLPTFPPPSPNPDGKEGGGASPNASTSNLAFLSYPYPPKPSKKLLPSTRLAAPLTKADKPWMKQKDLRTRLSYWTTLLLIFLGAVGAGVICFFGVHSVNTLPAGALCMVLNEDFGGGGIDTDATWNQINSISGFGSNYFHIASDSSTNTFIKNGQLYIYPTLTSLSPDSGLTADQVAGSANYTVPNCSEQSTQVRQGNRTVTVAGSGCSVSSSNALGKVINPAMSGRLTTMGKREIRYGKVEIRAKLPQGDWLHPTISLLPSNPAYGLGPRSGRIDILSSRGNTPTSPSAKGGGGRGGNSKSLPLGFTSATNEAGAYFGPFEATKDSAGSTFTPSSMTPSFLAPLSTSVSGALTFKRSLLNEGFHTYVVEWTPEWMRWYVDGRVSGKVGEVQLVGKGFGAPKGRSIFDYGKFPKTAKNGSTEVVVENPWAGGAPSAPFDQSFYLALDLAVGGTSGFFPDNMGNKPWFDGSETAMRDFLNAQDEWYGTWPENEDQRAFRIDSVKMWKICNID